MPTGSRLQQVNGLPTGRATAIPSGPPPRVAFQQLACVACPDPDSHALRRAISRDAQPRRAVLSFCVGTDGNTNKVHVKQSSGERAVDEVLTASVQKWRFRPYRVAGKPHATCSSVDFNLRLR